MCCSWDYHGDQCHPPGGMAGFIKRPSDSDCMAGFCKKDRALLWSISFNQKARNKRPTYAFLTTGGKMTVQKSTYSSLVRFFFPPLHHGLVYIAQRVPSFAVRLRLAPIEVARQRMQNVWALQREDRMFPNYHQNRTKNIKKHQKIIPTNDCLEKNGVICNYSNLPWESFFASQLFNLQRLNSSTLQRWASRP